MPLKNAFRTAKAGLVALTFAACTPGTSQKPATTPDAPSPIAPQTAATSTAVMVCIETAPAVPNEPQTEEECHEDADCLEQVRALKTCMSTITQEAVTFLEQSTRIATKIRKDAQGLTKCLEANALENDFAEYYRELQAIQGISPTTLTTCLQFRPRLEAMIAITTKIDETCVTPKPKTPPKKPAPKKPADPKDPPQTVYLGDGVPV